MDNLEQILKVLFRRVSAKSVLNGWVDGTDFKQRDFSGSNIVNQKLRICGCFTDAHLLRKKAIIITQLV